MVVETITALLIVLNISIWGYALYYVIRRSKLNFFELAWLETLAHGIFATEYSVDLTGYTHDGSISIKPKSNWKTPNWLFKPKHYRP